MMHEKLDLLLLSEEIAHDFSGAWVNPRKTYHRELLSDAYRRIAVTEAQKAAIESRYEVGDYLYRTPEGGVGLSLPHRPSLALADLATIARGRGYGVRVIDNFMRWPSRFNRVSDICSSTPPRLIGLSTTFVFSPHVIREIVAILRDLAPDCKIALGGPTVRRLPELHDCADFAVFGSGEESLIGLLEALDGTRLIASVPRIAYVVDGRVAYGPEGVDAAQLGRVGEPYKALPGETIPTPDWSLYPRSREQVHPIEFSRGCKYNCYYCSYDRGKNIRNLGDIREELEQNARLGIRKYRFSDSNFTDGPPSHRTYAHDVCRTIIDLGLDLEWSCYARVDDVSEELARLMRQAGCFAVFFGIESGDDNVLKLMRKGHDARDAARGVRIVQEAGIRAHANFVVGYPGETLESNERTLEFIQRVRPDTVAMGQFWAEEKTPVMGPRMKELRLVGGGLHWTHATMASEQASELVQTNARRLLAAGITLGNEYEICGFMSYGLSLEDALQHVEDVNAVQPESAATEVERRAASARIHAVITETFPKAIAEDWRLMQTA